MLKRSGKTAVQGMARPLVLGGFIAVCTPLSVYAGTITQLADFQGSADMWNGGDASYSERLIRSSYQSFPSGGSAGDARDRESNRIGGFINGPSIPFLPDTKWGAAFDYVIEMDHSVFAEISAGFGNINLDLPFEIELEILNPENLLPGESIQIRANPTLLPTAALTSQLQGGSASLNQGTYLRFNADFNICAGSCINVDPLGRSFVIDGNFTDDFIVSTGSDLIASSAAGFEVPDVLSDLISGAFADEAKFESPDLETSGTLDGGSLTANGTDTFADLQIKNALAALKPYGSILEGGTVSRAGFSASYELMGMDATFGMDLNQEFSLEEQDLFIELDFGDGKVFRLTAGELAEIVIPESWSPEDGVEVTYFLDAEVRNKTTLDIASLVKLKGLNFGLDIPGASVLDSIDDFLDLDLGLFDSLIDEMQKFEVSSGSPITFATFENSLLSQTLFDEIVPYSLQVSGGTILASHLSSPVSESNAVILLLLGVVGFARIQSSRFHPDTKSGIKTLVTKA